VRGVHTDDGRCPYGGSGGDGGSEVVYCAPMAAWHVDFTIVPRRALAAAGPSKLLGSATAQSWGAEPLPADYRQKLGAAAEPTTSASADRQTWGTEDGNRIDVWSVDGRATRVTAHVDVRRLDARFGAMLLQFARTADAVLVRGDGLVIEPLVGAFGAALRSSSAWRFANDPAAQFAKYAEPADEEE
jgi:hypothetical protein